MDIEAYIFLYLFAPVIAPLIGIVIGYYRKQAREEKERQKKQEIHDKIQGLSRNSLEMTAEEFLEMRRTHFGGQGHPIYALNYNFEGVYILHNKTKNLYYVGQGKQVLNRVYSHFTGKGNGDVYADYKYGDEFTVKAIALQGSGFYTLNELERNTIMTYDSFACGYNKTRGNR